MLLLLSIALAASPSFVFDDTDPAAYFVDGTNRFAPTAPYTTWRDVGYVLDVDPLVDVECEQGSGAQIRMASDGRVQMRALSTATQGAECRILWGDHSTGQIFIDFAGGG